MCCKIITDNLISAINSLQMQLVYSLLRLRWCKDKDGGYRQNASVVKLSPAIISSSRYSITAAATGACLVTNGLRYTLHNNQRCYRTIFLRRRRSQFSALRLWKNNIRARSKIRSPEVQHRRRDCRDKRTSIRNRWTLTARGIWFAFCCLLGPSFS